MGFQTINSVGDCFVIEVVLNVRFKKIHRLFHLKTKLLRNSKQGLLFLKLKLQLRALVFNFTVSFLGNKLI